MSTAKSYVATTDIRVDLKSGTIIPLRRIVYAENREDARRKAKQFFPKGTKIVSCRLVKRWK